jgi:16S rRNA (cytosine967-C5)-methyltransferase
MRGFLRDVEKGTVPLPHGTVYNNSASDDKVAVINAFPQWLVKRWTNRFGTSQTERLLLTLNKVPEFTIRVNERSIKIDEAIRKLEILGLRVKPGIFLKSALRVDRLTPLINNDLLATGSLYIQDEASQLAVCALRLTPGTLILDACSGQGTKASNILDLYDGIKLFEMDISSKRLHISYRRMNTVQGDVFHVPFKDNTFDTILLDAPCSSLGIIRKHPEIKWRRKEKEIKRFGAKQYEMLKSLWTSLKVGGHLIYCVCSFEPEETVDIIERFKKDRDFSLENPLPFLFNNEYFVSLPHETEMDGFFIARLKKL